MHRPDLGAHDAYYSTYIDRVPGRPMLEVMAEAADALDALLGGLTLDEETYAYASGKWSIRDVVGHVIDTERLFSYRALHIARADPAELPGMEQELWAAASNANERPLADLLAEFRALRTANTALFGSFDEATFSRRGIASELEFTVRALLYIIAGHELHHRDVLEELYLPGVATGSDPHA